MVAFYLLINGSYKRELVFIRKLSIFIYSNFIALFFRVLHENQDRNFCRENAKLIHEVTNRDFGSLDLVFSEDVASNNSKIFRIVEFQVKFSEPRISNCISQLKEFINDCSLKEALSYLIDVFSDLVH